MGDIKGFLKVRRQESGYRPKEERLKDWRDVSRTKPEEANCLQASRCMDCGTPFCHWACPLGNYIPEWNDYLFLGNWEKAAQLLFSTNNLPEITGRLCPALCEYGCVLGISDEAVTIRENELAIAEYAFRHNFVKPRPPEKRKPYRVAVVGSGPSGLACADELNKKGYNVVVFEKDKKPGGILRYGIPDFKLEKHILDRRISLWKKEGIEFKTRVEVGKDYSAAKLVKEFDAACLCLGSRQPRDLNIPGRSLNGIHFAMDYLTQANRRVAGERIENEPITARGKKVLVIGGGDTGSDCVGTANRQGAKSVVQIELLPPLSKERLPQEPWPLYAHLLKTTSSHEEGAERMWQVLTKEFKGDTGKVEKAVCVKVEFEKDVFGRFKMKEIPGSEFEIKADLVILAVGFLHPVHKGLVEELGLELDKKGNIKTDNFMTSQGKIFSAGDARCGQSLIVWAISEGRGAAASIDKFLTSKSLSC